MRMPATFAAGIRKVNRLGVGLENELRAELNRARIANGGDLAVNGTGYVRLNCSEVRLVEDVEGFAAKLNLLAAFANANILEDGEVKTLGRRSVHSAAASVAHDVSKRRDAVGRVQLEAGGIEPLQECLRATCVWIAQSFRSIARDQGWGVAEPGRIKVCAQPGKRQTRLKRYDAG